MLRCDRRTVVEALAIASLALALGLALNHRMVLEALTPPAEPPGRAVPAATPGYPAPVRLAEVRQLLAAGAVAVDARSRAHYREGHLPGARSLPLEESGAHQTLTGLLPADRPLIVYCSGYGCTDSFDLGVKLLAAGYRQVSVYEGGWPEWLDAGLPVEGGGQ